MSQIYDARTGTYIRGGTNSADPGGQSVYHIDDWQNASSYKNPDNPKSVFYKDDPALEVLADVAASKFGNTYNVNNKGVDYSPILQGFLDNFVSSNGALHDIMEGQLQLAERNSALSQEMADKANQFSHDEALQARAWSAEQAKLNRDWQTRMSNTAHQREVNDLIAAGLNPILSANTGAAVGSSGVPSASMGSSHQGQVDTTSAYQMATQLYGQMMNNAVQLQALGLEREKMNMQRELTEKNINADLEGRRITGEFNYKSAQASAYGNIESANIHSASNQYVSDQNAKVRREEMEHEKTMQENQFAHDEEMQSERLGVEQSEGDKNRETSEKNAGGGLIGRMFDYGEKFVDILLDQNLADAFSKWYYEQ